MAKDSFVCGLVSGTRKVYFDFIDNTQDIGYGELFGVEEVNMLWANVPEYLGSMENTRNHSMAPCDDFLDVYWNDNPLLGDGD